MLQYNSYVRATKEAQQLIEMFGYKIILADLHVNYFYFDGSEVHTLDVPILGSIEMEVRSGCFWDVHQIDYSYLIKKVDDEGNEIK